MQTSKIRARETELVATVSRTFLLGLLILMAMLVMAPKSPCAPAIPASHQLRQPDGSIFEARLWGDEKSHGWETVSGHTVIRDERTLYWHYAEQDPQTKGLVPGPIVGIQPVDKSAVVHLRPQTDAVKRSFESTRQPSDVRGTGSAAISDTRRLPVLMVNFGDTDTTYDRADFEQVLFGSGNGSLKEYYREVSYGTFSVAPGTSGVSGWYDAARPHDYYGANGAGGYDQAAAELVAEAVASADAEIDFSEYDTDGDCYTDAVVIIHQGSGEEAGGPATDIWSHRWDLRSAAYYGDGDGVYVTNDVAACGQVKVNDYVIQPETLDDDIQTVGVFAHEYGHILGLPDLYDIDGSSSGIGNWGLMGAGSWNGIQRWGDSPAHLSAWSKYQLGWVNPVVVQDPLAGERIEPASQIDDVYLFYPADQSGGWEYFLVENRQRIGFDAGLPGTGLAIWHIDDSISSNYNTDNTRECLPGQDCSDTHYRVSLVQADGYWDLEYGFNRGDQGDLFPGRFGNTSLTRASDPDNLLYDGTSSLVSITHITQSDAVITADMALACTITPGVSSGGSISPGDPATFALGETVTFTLTPESGYQVDAIYVDGQPMGALNAYTFSDLQSDHDIRAEFIADGRSPDTPTDSGGSGSGGGCFISTLVAFNVLFGAN